MTIGRTVYRRLNRRHFLRIGGAGLFGLSWSRLFEAQAAPAKRQARQLIVVWMGGGPPHIDMFDMKPDAPEDIRGAWKPIQTKLPGLLTNDLMPGLARVADKLTIVRSFDMTAAGMYHGHHGGWEPCFSGWSRVPQTGDTGGRPGTLKYPLVGNVMSRELPVPKDVPAYVHYGQPSMAGYNGHDSYLGAAHDAVRLSIGSARDPLMEMLAPPPALLDPAILEQRVKLLRALDEVRERVDQGQVAPEASAANQKALDLLRSPTFSQALDLQREPARSAERYGKGDWARWLLAARRLIEAGVPCVFVNLHSWDFHGSPKDPGTDAVYKSASSCFANYSAAMSALIEDLGERGLLDSTIVVSGGEMGRTPKPENGTRGARGHWPQAGSFLFAGGGFRRGCIVGETDRQGAAVKGVPFAQPSLARTLYHLLGIDPEQEVLMPDGRPMKIVAAPGPIIQEALA